MAPNEILTVLQEKPFVPFRIHVSDGTSHDVRHPELCMPGTRTIIVGIPADPATPLADRHIRIDVLHITKLESLPVTLSTQGNGQTA